MIIVITGASGLLGRYLLKTQPQKEFEGMGLINEHDIIPCYRNNPIPNGFKLDLSDPIKQLFEIEPDLIIHCAANGDVDDVEQNPAEAVKSDLLATIELMRYCEKMKCKLITISTNAVYDGHNPPYEEYSQRHPVNLYGKIKSLADDIIMKSTCEWMIIRPIFLYGWPNKGGRENWVTKIITAKKELKLVTDSYTQPTYAGDVASVIWDHINRDTWRFIHNVSSVNEISIYEFGLMVKGVFNLECNISQSKLSSFKSIAPRPLNTCFGTGFLRNAKNGLQKMKDENN